jgi:hypothetical protein
MSIAINEVPLARPTQFAFQNIMCIQLLCKLMLSEELARLARFLHEAEPVM